MTCRLCPYSILLASITFLKMVTVARDLASVPLYSMCLGAIKEFILCQDQMGESPDPLTCEIGLFYPNRPVGYTQRHCPRLEHYAYQTC